MPKLGRYYLLRDHNKITMGKVEEVNSVNVSFWSFSVYGNGWLVPLSLIDGVVIKEITNKKAIDAFENRLRDSYETSTLE